MTRDDNGRQHVPLAVAAATVHQQLVGTTVVGAGGVSPVLDDTAHALASIVPVYVVDGNGGKPRPLAATELLKGKFSEGASRFAVPGGPTYTAISVVRQDMRDALVILKKAGVRLR